MSFKREKSNLENLLPVIWITIAFVFAVSCSDPSEAEEPECHANVDCEGETACVNWICIEDKASCEKVGSFYDITEISPSNADTVDEIHVTVAPDGAVHYCYWGTKDNSLVAFYGKQTAWNAFEEEKIIADDVPARCGGIVISSDGTPVVLSRNHVAVLFRKGKGVWSSVRLKGLEGKEAGGEVDVRWTSISLNADNNGGVLLGLSLGYRIEAQPIYSAQVSKSGIKVFVNGWSENGDHTEYGYSPQLLDTDEGIVAVMGQMLSYEIVLSTPKLGMPVKIDGGFPRIAINSSGTASVLYLDRNFILHIDKIGSGAFSDFATVGMIEIDPFADGLVPLDFCVDDYGSSHLLIEDAWQGIDSLVYRAVNSKGEASEPVIITSHLGEDLLPESQLYGIGADFCGRPTVAAVVIADDDGENTDETIKIRIIEQR